MRLSLALSLGLLAAPVSAWEFTPVPVCTLSHAEAGATLRITHDPRQDLPYALALSGPAPWPDAPSFAIRFEGGMALTIVTREHRLSEDRSVLSVADRGFGNVLNGLEFNATATALLGEVAVPFGLEGAPGPVRDFRACAVPAVS
jgi:hypothetical protein